MLILMAAQLRATSSLTLSLTPLVLKFHLLEAFGLTSKNIIWIKCSND